MNQIIANKEEKTITLRASERRDVHYHGKAFAKSSKVLTTGVNRASLKLEAERIKKEKEFLKEMEAQRIAKSREIKNYLRKQQHRDVVVQKAINAKLQTQVGQSQKSTKKKKLGKLKSKFNDLAIDAARREKEGFDLFSTAYDKDEGPFYEATMLGAGEECKSEEIISSHFITPDSPEMPRVRRDIYTEDLGIPDETTLPWVVQHLGKEKATKFLRKFSSGDYQIQRYPLLTFEEIANSSNTTFQHLEKFCMLLITLRGCSYLEGGTRKYNITGCASAIWMWLSTYTDMYSMYNLGANFGGEVFANSVAGIFTGICETSSELFQAGLNFVFELFGYESEYYATSDFKDIVQSPLMTDCAALFAELGATGIMAATGFWSPEFNKWYREIFVSHIKGSANIITTTIDIIQQLVEGGKLWWKSGDFRDLFCANNLREVQSEMMQHRVDSLFVVDDGGSPDNIKGLYERINATITKLARVSLHYGPVHRYSPAILKMRDELNKVLGDIKTIMKKGTIRTTPIVFELYGSPGVGKTILLYELIFYALRMTGVPNPNIGMIAHINETDKFDSTIHNGTRAIVLDDVGAVRQNVLAGPPMITKIINFVNPVPSPTNQAELASKGAIYAMPNVVGVTTNIKDLKIDESLNVPEATARRVPLVINFMVPKSLCFEKTLKLDKSKLKQNIEIHRQVYYKVEVRSVEIESGRLIPMVRHFIMGHALDVPILRREVTEFDDGFGNKVVDYDTMMLIFSDIAADTWKRSQVYKQHIDGVMGQASCPKCYLPSSLARCACSFLTPELAPALQDLEEEILLNVEEVVEDSLSPDGVFVDLSPDVVTEKDVAIVEYEATMIWPNAGQVSLMLISALASPMLLYFFPIHRGISYPFNVLNFYQRKIQYKIAGAVKGVAFMEGMMEAESELRSMEDEMGAEIFKIFQTKRSLVRFLALAGGLFVTYKTIRYVFNVLNPKKDDAPFVINNNITVKPPVQEEPDIESDKVKLDDETEAIKRVVDKDNPNLVHEGTTVRYIAGQHVDINIPPIEQQAPYMYPKEYKQDRVPYVSDITKGLNPALSNTTYPALISKLVRNCFIILMEGGKFNGFFLRDQILVTVAHGFPPAFFESPDSVIRIVLKNQFTTTSPMDVERRQVVRGDGDIAYIHLSPVNRYTDVSKYCRTFKNGSVALPLAKGLAVKEDSGVISHDQVDLTNGRFVQVDVKIPVYGNVVRALGYEFDGSMDKGSSGCPIILIAGQTASIIGIQSAVGNSVSVMQKLDDFCHEDFISKFQIDTLLQAQVKQFISPPILPSPGPFSAAVHLEGGALDYVGTLVDHHPVRNKTSFRRSILYSSLTENGYFFDRGRKISEERYVIPELSPFTIVDDNGDKRWVSAKLIGVAQAATPDVVEAPQILIDLCHADYMSVVETIQFPVLSGPVSLHDVLNGAQGVKSINMKASAGFFHKGLIKDLVQGGPGSYTLKPEIQREYELLEKQIFSGEAPAQLVTVNVKDEIVKESKLASLRVFMCFPALFTVLSKRYLTPLLNIILANPEAFEVALGINALGKTWTQMFIGILQRKYILDGDYKKYDKKQMRRILLSFKRFLYTISMKSGYPAWSTRMAMFLVDMMIYHVIVLGADLFELDRSLPSGCLLTIFFNCYVNSIYFRMAWFSEFTTPFRMMNTLRTFGDDALNGTNQKEFNMQFISKLLAEYGVTFTAASKEESDAPFSTPEKVTFLKRGFKKTLLSDGNEYYLCPLAEVSIFKMLAFTDSTHEDEALIMCANLLDAQKQYWFHGKELFHSMTSFLKEVASKANLSGSVHDEGSSAVLRWSTYEEIEMRYLDGSLQVQFL